MLSFTPTFSLLKVTEMILYQQPLINYTSLPTREAAIRDNPDTVHKVLVEFALTFKKEGRKKDEELRNMIENSSRVGEMPVFADSLDVKGKPNKKMI